MIGAGDGGVGDGSMAAAVRSREDFGAEELRRLACKAVNGL